MIHWVTNSNELQSCLSSHFFFKSDEKPEVLEVINSTKLHYEYNGTIQCLAFGMPLPNITWIRDGYQYEGNENATIVSYAIDDHHVISEIQFHPYLMIVATTHAWQRTNMAAIGHHFTVIKVHVYFNI